MASEKCLVYAKLYVELAHEPRFTGLAATERARAYVEGLAELLDAGNETHVARLEVIGSSELRAFPFPHSDVEADERDEQDYCPECGVYDHDLHPSQGSCDCSHCGWENDREPESPIDDASTPVNACPHTTLELDYHEDALTTYQIENGEVTGSREAEPIPAEWEVTCTLCHATWTKDTAPESIQKIASKAYNYTEPWYDDDAASPGLFE